MHMCNPYAMQWHMEWLAAGAAQSRRLLPKQATIGLPLRIWWGGSDVTARESGGLCVWWSFVPLMPCTGPNQASLHEFDLKLSLPKPRLVPADQCNVFSA